MEFNGNGDVRSKRRCGSLRLSVFQSIDVKLKGRRSAGRIIRPPLRTPSGAMRAARICSRDQRLVLRERLVAVISPVGLNEDAGILPERGRCLLRAQAGGKFEMLANNKLAEDDVCVATPALAGDRLFIRTATRVNSSSRLATRSCSISAGHWLRVCRPSTFRALPTRRWAVRRQPLREVEIRHSQGEAFQHAIAPRRHFDLLPAPPEVVRGSKTPLRCQSERFFDHGCARARTKLMKPLALRWRHKYSR